MAGDQLPSNPTGVDVDPYKHVEVSLNPDGSLSRYSKMFPDHPPSPTPVITQDAETNLKGGWIRIYLPTHDLSSKLPVIFYFHGGGFILFTPATSVFHVFSSGLASHLPAIVVSINYRLAPEHRLPAAYEDSLEALDWINSNWARLDWLRDHGDPSSCFLMGTSAGGNIAYHVALRLPEDPGPCRIRIRGLVLHTPFFGGTRRTRSETTQVSDLFLRPGVTDLMWELALPVGEDRDHEYCNIRFGDGPSLVHKLGWKVLVTDFQGDPLYDYTVEAVEFMREKGVEVVVDFPEGGYHAADVFDPAMAKPFHVALKTYMDNILVPVKSS